MSTNTERIEWGGGYAEAEGITVGSTNVRVDDDRWVVIHVDGAVPPATARVLASVLVAAADAAESEDDPAEVKELAKLLREHGDCGGSLRWDAARAVLRAGYKREAAP